MTIENRAGRESVLQRALEAADKARRSERHHSRMPLVELLLRDASQTGDGSYVIEGHAAVINSEYTLYENKAMGVRVRERISATAFDAVLAANPDVHLNINHDMSTAIARTGVQGVGGLALSMDGKGLRFQARVDRTDPDVIGLSSKMRLGVIDQASFAFTIGDETRTSVETDDMTDVLYEINVVDQLFDVCVCAQGAAPQTDSSLRSLEAAVGLQVDSAWATHRHQAIEPLGDVSVVTADPAVGVLGSARVHLAKAQAVARTRLAIYSPKE